MTKEQEIEQRLIKKLKELKYSHRPDIHDREALEQNFRKQFEALNRVRLTDDEFARLLNDVINPDVFACAEHLRHRNSFEREDGTPLHYQLVNLKDWCKNRFEVVSQLRINTRSSHHRYDVILLINGLPLVQIELKGPGSQPASGPCSRSSNTSTTPETVIPTACFVSCSFLLSAISAKPGISPTTQTSISVSTPTNVFCPSIGSPRRITRRSTTWMNLPTPFWRSAPWPRCSAATWC